MRFPIVPYVVIAMLCLVPFVRGQKKNTIQRFGDGDMPLIRTKVRFTTLVVLPEGEEIAEVVCGDKEYWVIEGKDNIVYVKPAKEGAFTNLNIVSKNRVVHSFLVQEISKPGNSKEKPDLKIVLGEDEVTKLRKDKENLEVLFLRTERSTKEQSEGKDDDPKKKEETEPPNLNAPKTEVKEEEPKPLADVESTSATNNSEPPTPPLEGSAAAAAPTPESEPEPVADFRIVKVDHFAKAEPSEGLIRKTGRALGRFFRKVSKTFHIY